MRKFVFAGVCALVSASAATAASSRADYDAWLATPALDARGTSGVRQTALRRHLREHSWRGNPTRWDARDKRPSFLWIDPARSFAPSGVDVVEPSARAEYAAREALRRFAGDLGVDRGTLDQALLRDSQDHGDGRAVIARLQQRYEGLDVFARSLAVAMRADYSPVAIAGYFAPVPGADEIAAFSLDGASLTAAALQDLAGVSPAAAPAEAGGSGEYRYFQVSLPSGADYRLTRPVRGKRVYYSLAGKLIPAWYLELFGETIDGASQDAYGYVFSAADGALLFRRDLSDDAAFSYRVFADTSAPYHPFDGPLGNERAPLEVPDPDFKPPRVSADSALVSLGFGPISTEDPWLIAGDTESSGNNVDAYLDRSPPDGFTDASDDRRATTTSNGVFDYPIAADGDPTAPETQSAAVVNLFYLNNWLHDWWYDNGFDEVSGNAQFDNYGRGGVAGDPILAQAQDYSGRNNANMSTPADGSSPRMQMYLWNGLVIGSFEVLSPPLGEFDFGIASFGPGSYAVTNDVVDYVDGTAPSSDACESATNASALRGRIALLDRGSCDFTVKVANAQAAGAVAAIVVNNVDEPPITMGGGPAPAIRIPSMMLSLDDGTAIRAALADGPVNVHMQLDETPLLDGTIDFQIVSHEWFHYTSNRLVGNASGLSNPQGRGMGEGWSDFSAMMLTVRESDLAVPSNPDYAGVYGMASYVVDDPYFGIRRTPYSTNFDYNPLTFRHIENGVPLPDTAPIAFGTDGASNAEVHNAGEIWANVLWEGYAALLNSGHLNFSQAQARMKDYVIGGLKMTPNAPTFLEARDGILAAAAATDELDFERLAGAFAKRGMGVGAVAPDRADENNSGVVESYTALGTELALDDASFDMSINNGEVGYCDTDAYLDLGEGGMLWVTLAVDGNVDLGSGLTGHVSADGVEFFESSAISFPPVAAGGSTSAAVGVKLVDADSREYKTFTIDFDDPDPSDNAVLVPDSLSFSKQVDLDLVRERSQDDFEQPEASANDWTTTFSGSGEGWAITDAFIDSFESAVFYVPDNGATSDASLISPPITVGSGAFSLSFEHYFAFELNQAGPTVNGYDGGVIEISIDGGAWTDIFDAGAVVTSGSGYNGSLRDPSRPAFVGELNATETLQAVSLDFAGTLAGSTIQVRFRELTDAAVGAFGWVVDNVAVSGAASPPFLRVVADDHVCVPRPPIVVAPDDFSSPERTEDAPYEQATITLAGTANDLDGDPLSYSWRQIGGPTVSLQGVATPTASFVAPAIDADTVLRFRFTASDGGASASDVVVVTLLNVETPPKAIVPEPFSAPEREDGASTQATIALSGSAEDPDGSELGYLWTQTSGPPVEILDADRAEASFVAPLVDADTELGFTLTASDDSGSGSADLVVTVLNVESAPLATAPADFSVLERPVGSDEQTVVTLKGTAEDPDGTEGLSYQWTQTAGPSVDLQNADTLEASFATPAITEVTVLTFLFTANDGTSESSDSVNVTVVERNAAPVLTMPEDFSAPERAADSHEQATISMTATATDADGQTLSYLWRQIAGPAVVLSGAESATASFVAPAIDADIELTFGLTVSDGIVDTSGVVQVTVLNVETPPVAIAPDDFSTPERTEDAVGQALIELAGGSEDPDGSEVSYLWTQTAGPPVTLVNAGSPSASFTAPKIDADTALTFKLTVSDDAGSDDDLVTVTVTNVDSPPTAIAPADFATPERISGSDEQALVELAGDAEDLDGLDDLSYHWRQLGGPDVVLQNQDAQVASFRTLPATEDIVLTFELTVSDGLSEGSDTVIVTVTDANAAPHAAAPADFSAAERADGSRSPAEVSLVGSGTDADGNALSYRWRQTAGPAVTIANANSATASFLTPAISADSVLTFALTVSDGKAETSDSVAVTILNVDTAPLAIVPAGFSVAERAEGSVEQAAVSVTGSADDPDGLAGMAYAWTQVSGTPVSLSGAATSTLSFTVPKLSADAVIGLQLQVTDPSGLSDTATVELTLTNVESAPVATAPEDFSTPERVVPTFKTRRGTRKAEPAAEQATVVLEGRGFDLDDDVLSYAWTQLSGPSVTLEDADMATASFAAPHVTADTELVFKLTVSDGKTVDAADTVTVTILNLNTTPVAVAALDAESYIAGDTVGLDGSGSSDPDGEPISYLWLQLDGPMVELSDPAAATPSFLAATEGSYVFGLTVTDEEGASSEAHVSADVGPAPPVVDEDGAGNSGGDGGAFGWASLAGLGLLLGLRRRYPEMNRP